MAGAPIDFPSSWTGENFVPPTPLDITTIERAIVNQLRSAIGDQVEVGHFPDRPEAYRLTHRVGAAQVIFQGADYGELLDANYVVQERTLHFGVRVMTRDLGWAYGGQPSGLSPGGYGLLEAIRAALAGFIVPGCTKMVPERERFLDHDEQGAVWFYSIEFALRTMAIEVEPNRN